MRNLVLSAATLALATLIPALVKPASAVEYAYCATGASILAGGCSYTTLEPCRAFVHGYSGQCVPNPHYTPAAKTAGRTPRPRR
jgi:hypothetical protein